MKPLTDFNDMSDPEAIRQRVNSAIPIRFGSIDASPDITIIKRFHAPAPVLDLGVFGPWAEWISTAAEAKSAPIDYVVMCLITALAGLVGAARWVQPWDGWAEPCVIWVMLIGQPSAGKSPAMDALRNGIAEIEKELAIDFEDVQREYETAFVAAKARADKWEAEASETAKSGKLVPTKPAEADEPDAPVPPRVIITDTTVEASAAVIAGNRRGVLLWRDELAAWLANINKYGDGERAYWLEGYGARSYTVDRKKLSKPLLLPHLAISILGGIQPDRMNSLLMGGSDDDGLAARFLSVWPEPVPPLRPTKRIDDQKWTRACRRLRKLDFRRTADGDFEHISLSVDSAALDEFQAWREHHHAESAAVSNFVASAWGKMPGQVLRLALVLEYLWWAAESDDVPEPQVVSRVAIGNAIDLIELYFKPMLTRTFGAASQPKADRDAATLGRAILARASRPTVINAREVRRDWGLPGLNTAGDTDAAINVLLEANWLFPATNEEGKTVGRKRKDFVINTAIYRSVP